ncbi:polysaccharide deacetylase family protein [Cryptosporangium sp. NPDC051539]|uniref:polysaccharide deacetylase family protein n=1 Tax=Cryptosporangium sp. NPDC051539 TaxID=3363962 RepID=UPI0037A0C695
MDRRSVLTGVAVAVVAALSGCADDHRPVPARPSNWAPSAAGSATTDGTPADTSSSRFDAPVGLVKAPIPRGTITRLPGTGRCLALTIDDGTSSAVLGAYAQLCRDTGLRATFFCNGINESWTEHAPVLRPLVENNQIFLANHTWSHPDLLHLSAAEVTDQVQRNEQFLKNTYGVTGRPFLRPPFGHGDGRLNNQLADLGYPGVTMWLGSLGDAIVQPPQKIVALAEQWFQPQHVVIGHANHRPVIKVMDRLMGIIEQKRLQPVHLGDVFTV